MKTLYLQCNMGAAGDMLMAALYELLEPGARQEFLRDMNALGIPGLEVAATPAQKCGIWGTHMDVRIGGQEEHSHDLPHGHCHSHGEGQEHGHCHSQEHGQDGACGCRGHEEDENLHSHGHGEHCHHEHHGECHSHEEGHDHSHAEGGHCHHGEEAHEHGDSLAEGGHCHGGSHCHHHGDGAHAHCHSHAEQSRGQAMQAQNQDFQLTAPAGQEAEVSEHLHRHEQGGCGHHHGEEHSHCHGAHEHEHGEGCGHAHTQEHTHCHHHGEKHEGGHECGCHAHEDGSIHSHAHGGHLGECHCHDEEGHGHCHSHDGEHTHGECGHHHSGEHGHCHGGEEGREHGGHCHHHDEEHEHCHGHEGEHSHCHGHEHGHTHEHGHSHSHSGMADIEHLLAHLPVSGQVRENALAVYRLIAQAESHAHGQPVSQIHFHEVGTMDAVADVVGVCMLMERIGAQKILASAVHVGSGQVRCAHGVLPVPAPATAHILQGVPTYGGEIAGELCTPTGAALLRHFAQGFGPMPALCASAIGYGMGTKDFAAANCVRAFLGDDGAGEGGPNGEIALLCCNLDDMPGEDLGFAQQALLDEGALDVYTLPIGMKKNRPAVLLCCICQPDAADKLAAAMLRHTSTFGVRKTLCQRYMLSRSFEQVQTPCGAVRIKTGQGYGVKKSKAEYEDIARIAREQGISLAEARALLK